MKKLCVYVSNWATILKTHVLQSILHSPLKSVANWRIKFLLNVWFNYKNNGKEIK